MASYTALVPLAIALALIVIVPGPNVLAVTTTAMRNRGAGVRMALGVSSGDMVWAVSALAGLGAALTHARPVFEALRWAGVAYLLFFAWRLWRSETPSSPEAPAPATQVGPQVRHAFLRGMVIDLANPKAAIFFTTLFASLLPADLDVGFSIGVLAVTAAIVYTWYLALALVFSQPRVQRGYQRVSRRVNRIAAGAIGALGLRLALDGA